MPPRHIGICAHYKEENVVASPTTWLCPMLLLLLLLAVALKWFILISRVNWLKNARLTEQQRKQGKGKGSRLRHKSTAKKNLQGCRFHYSNTLFNASNTQHLTLRVHPTASKGIRGVQKLPEITVPRRVASSDVARCRCEAEKDRKRLV